MTRVLVFEWCTAIGPDRLPPGPGRALYPLGRAMRDAVADDLRRVPGLAVATAAGVAGDPERDLARRASGHHLAVVIAPETDGRLERCSRAAQAAGAELLGSGPEAAAVAADKLGLAARWRAAGVPTPPTRPLSAGVSAFPAVVKPRTGAGAVATFRVAGPPDLARAAAAAAADGFPVDELIAQPFVPGLPASVGFLVGPAGAEPLPPLAQRVTAGADGRLGYDGGEGPLPRPLADRATAVGRRAVGCVPGLCGFVGVDLILGAAADGSEDVAVELNPRVTVAYVGLRRLAAFNLGERLWRVATGQPTGPAGWRTGGVRFAADGATAGG